MKVKDIINEASGTEKDRYENEGALDSRISRMISILSDAKGDYPANVLVLLHSAVSEIVTMAAKLKVMGYEVKTEETRDAVRDLQKHIRKLAEIVK